MLSKEEIENKEELLKRISKEQYGDEWFIEKAILSYKGQKEKTYTFFRDDEEKDLLKKYNWCQRPSGSNMSLDRFVINGEVEGYMSESLAEHFGLVQVDLNEFIHKFVKLIIKENFLLKNKIDQLEQENKALKKGQTSLMSSRKKWKDRYYKEKCKFNKVNKINDEMVDSFYKLYQKIPGTMHKFFENGKPCEYGYDKENNDCKEINCKPCIKQYFEKKVEEK